jgi:outer membrane lipoprotein-sorting protein
MTTRIRPVLFSTLLVSSLLMPAIARTSAQATADEVIEKHLAAIGGREALAKLTSRRATGTVSIGTPNGDLGGPIELLAKAPNKVLVYISLDLSAMGMNDKMIIEQKFNGTAGWMLNSLQGDQEITGNQLDNMKNNFFPTPLLNYKANGAKVELQPREDVNGKSMFVLLMTPKTGSPTKLYFDPDTYYLMRTKASVTSPEMGTLEQQGDQSDYRTVDGIKVPFTVVNSNAMQSITIKLQKVEHNVAIDDAVFAGKTLLR